MATTTTLGDSLVSRKEAAEFLTVKPSTMADWAARKGRSPRHLPMVKIGKFARYKMSDLVAFVEANRSIPGSSQVDSVATPT